jgi:PAS domain S-box-containing protein
LTNHNAPVATPRSVDGRDTDRDESARRVHDLALDGIDALAIANTVREPLLVLDEQLCVRFANRAFYRHFGSRAEATVGVSLWTLADGQWDHPELRHLLEDVLGERTRFDDFELEQHLGALGHRVLSLNASEILVAQSGRRHVLLVIADVTDRRRAEREIAERTREVERFSMIASHDLQEPLRKIRAYGALLVDEFGPVLSDDGRDYLTRMANAAARMQALIRDLLALARTSTAEPSPEPLDLGTVLREVLGDLEIAAAGTSVVLGELPTLRADPVHMRQLFQNLLSNALKFRRPGVPLRVVVEARPRDRATGAHEIVVRDNGIGFDDRYAETIFGPFERLHGRHEYTGNGIGLAICRRIVERHHGSIAAQSVAGEGTTITIRLPAEEPPLRTSSPESASHP